MVLYHVSVVVTDPMLRRSWEEVVNVKTDKPSKTKTAAITALRKRYAWTGYTYEAKGVQTDETVPA